MTQRALRVLIVATGPSAAGVDLSDIPRRVHVIVVNDAITWCPIVDSFFTLDPSDHVRGLLADRRDGVRYYMAVPDDYGTPDARIVSHRPAPEIDVHFLRRIEGDGAYRAAAGLSVDPAGVHTGNSAYGALGLAFHMGARRVAFVGLDGTTDRYAYRDGRPRTDFDHLPGLFASAVPQLEAAGVAVRNGSPESRVTCWPRVEGDAAVRWVLR